MIRVALRRILFPIDSSGSRSPALGTAVRLAEEFGAELTLLQVVDTWNAEFGFSLTEGVYDRVDRMARSRLAELIRSGIPETVVARGIVRRGSCLAEIVAHAREHEIDLLVVSANRSSTLGRYAGKLVRLAPCPVLAVPRSPAGSEERSPRRILLPTGLSPRTDHALPYAVALARRHRSELLVLHVATLSERYRDHAFEFDPQDRLAAEGGPLPEPRLDASEPGSLRLALRVVHGIDPAEQILRIAREEGFDLIVMATRGLGGLRHLIHGSTAERVVAHAGCPVLTVKRPQHDFVFDGVEPTRPPSTSETLPAAIEAVSSPQERG